MDQPTELVTDFRVILLFRTVDGRELVYKSPNYRSTSQLGLGPALLQMAIARKLQDWIAAALGEKI